MTRSPSLIVSLGRALQMSRLLALIAVYRWLQDLHEPIPFDVLEPACRLCGPTWPCSSWVEFTAQLDSLQASLDALEAQP